MAAWNTDELDRIGAAEEVRVAARRPNGRLRKPVVVWIVRVNDDVYVRSVNGRNAAWFRGVQATHEGHVWADGVEKDVEFVDVSDTGPHRCGISLQVRALSDGRALSGQHPTTAAEVITWLEDTVAGWNTAPTPFVWDGKRRERRVRARQRRIGGSAATLAVHQLIAA